MKYKLLQIIIYYYFLSNNIYFTHEQFSDNISDSINKNQSLNKFIKFSEDNIYLLFKFRLKNNDILIISSTEEKCFIYELKSNGENYYEFENNTNYKTMNLSREFFYLNGAIVKIEKKEYPLICDTFLCRLIDYEDNIIYQKYLNEYFENRNLLKNKNFLSFQIINLNNENQILFCISSDGGILLRKINILSKNLEYQLISNFTDNEKFLHVNEDISKLSCFITEKKMIECLYINENKYWVAIFDELLNYKTKFALENEEYIVGEDGEYFNFYNCIHLKKEIGIFTYYIKTKEMDNIQLHLQINDLVLNDNKYIFKKFKNQNIIISLNRDNSSDFNNDLDFFSNKNLMKISDNRFSYVFNYLGGSIVLVIFDLYNNEQNIMIKYYKINLNSQDINPKYFFNVETFNYNSFIGILLIFSEDNIYKKPLLAIFGNSDYEENTKIILYENQNFEMKINEYINTKLNNNIFGYEVFFQISSIQECLNNIKLISTFQNKKIEINDTLYENDIILFDFTNINNIIKEPPYIEIKRIISEPEYEKYITLYDKIDIYGESDQKLFYKKRIIDEKIYKFIFNFSCYSTCETCYFGSFNKDNQKCLSCKSGENLCFMEKDKNCYNISNLIYNFYKSNNEIICIPHGEFCPNEYPFEIKDSKECVKECDYEDLINKYKIPSNEPNSIISVFDIIHDRIKTENFEEEIDKELTIEGYNITIQVTDSSKQKYYIDNRIITNLSIIDLFDCEKKLGLDKPLIIVKMDVNNNENSSPYVEYLIINPYTFEKMDISLCKDSKLNIYIPFEISENYYELYKYVKNYGYNIFNPSDKFYNDICTPFTTYNNTDVLIKDRKADYFYDYNFCEESCDFDDINLDINKAKCICEINNEITPNSKVSSSKFFEYFYKIEYYSNFRIIFCSNLVFSKNGLENNYGSYITLCLIFLFIVIMIINIITNSKKVSEILKKIFDEQKKIIILGKNNIPNKNNDDNLFKEKIKKLEVEKPQKNNNIIKKKKVKRKKKKYKSLTISKNVLQKMIYDNDNSKRRFSNNKMKNEFNIVASPPKKKLAKKMTLELKLNEFEDSNKKNSISVFSKDLRNINKKSTTKEKNIDNITDIIINNIEKEKRKFFFNSEELNSLSYNYALEIDDRNFFQYYVSLLKQKHLIIFTFLVNDDYNIFLSKLGLFIISFSLYLTVNAICFSDSSIHKLYKEKRKYNFVYQIPKILYSTIISSIASIILKQLSLSEKDILKIKKKLYIKELEEVIEEVKKCIRIKYILFFVIGFIFFSFFWYYLSCFCCIFANTQIPLIKDTLISYGLSMLYPFLLNILPGLLRIPSLKKNNRKILYNISRIIALI